MTLAAFLLFGCTLSQIECQDYHCFGAALRNNCQDAKLHAKAGILIDTTFAIEKQGGYCIYREDGNLEKKTEYLPVPIQECLYLGKFNGGAMNKDGECVSVNGLGD